MSTSYYVTAGPVLVCKYHIKEEVKVEIVRDCFCSKCNKIVKDQSNFHNKCGSPIEKREREEVKVCKYKSVGGIWDMMSDGDFREETFGMPNEQFIKDCDILIPQYDYLNRKTSNEVSDCYLIIHNPNTEDEIAKTEQFYAKEIAYLRTKYDEVKVEWMVFTTYS